MRQIGCFILRILTALLVVYVVQAMFSGLAWPTIWWDTIKHPVTIVDGHPVQRTFSLWPDFALFFLLLISFEAIAERLGKRTPGAINSAVESA